MSAGIPGDGATVPDEVTVRDEGAVRIVSLNRPARLNAISMRLLDALDAALAGADADPGVRAILLRGGGRAFSAGDDLHDQLALSASGRAAVVRQVAVLQRISEHMMFGAKPVVGAVQGWAVGGGFAWTLNCDFTLWAEGARGYLPEVAFGLFVSGGASWLLPRIAGPMAARELALLGRKLDANALAKAGIAWRVVPEARLLPEALALAQELAALPPAAVARMKRALGAGDRDGLRAAMALEAEACIAGALDPVTLDRLRAVLARGK